AEKGLGNGNRLVVHLNGRLWRQTNEALRGRVVGPLRRVDREGDDSRRRLGSGQRREQAGFAQLARETGAGVLDRIVWHQLVNAAAFVVIQEIELAVIVLTEGDDTEGGLRDLFVRNDAIAIEARTPSLARDPVAADVGTD